MKPPNPPGLIDGSHERRRKRDMTLDSIGTDPGAFCDDREVYYVTPVYKIGKTWWRMIVYSNKRWGRCTEYQWRKHEGDPWEPDTKWRTYNGNDSNGGLPKSVQRVYYRHQPQILAALGKGE